MHTILVLFLYFFVSIFFNFLLSFRFCCFCRNLCFGLDQGTLQQLQQHKDLNSRDRKKKAFFEKDQKADTQYARINLTKNVYDDRSIQPANNIWRTMILGQHIQSVIHINSGKNNLYYVHKETRFENLFTTKNPGKERLTVRV